MALVSCHLQLRDFSPLKDDGRGGKLRGRGTPAVTVFFALSQVHRNLWGTSVFFSEEVGQPSVPGTGSKKKLPQLQTLLSKV